MIRTAIPEDMPRLLEMGRAFNLEAGYAEDVPFDDASFARILTVLGNAALLSVADKGRGAIGMGAVDVAGSICNQQVKIAREVFWYVEPDHRNGLGRGMLDALECMARKGGAHLFDVVAEEGKRNPALARVYRASGFSPAEHTFRKRL